MKSAASRRVIDWRYPEFDHRCYRFVVTDISVVSFLACEIVSAACANDSGGRSDLIRPDKSVPSSARSLSRCFCCRRQASISSNKILHGRARESSKVARRLCDLSLRWRSREYLTTACRYSREPDCRIDSSNVSVSRMSRALLRGVRSS